MNKDRMGHTVDIPEKELFRMTKTCERCELHKHYIKAFGVTIDLWDCPYDCKNSIEHYRILHPENFRYE